MQDLSMPELTQHAEQLLPHILIVDDEPDIRQMVSLCFQMHSFRITCAENAAEAFKLLLTEQFDAIVSDVMMPGEDGIVFLGRVHESWPEIPVILMTGHAQLQMAVNAIKNGAFFIGLACETVVFRVSAVESSRHLCYDCLAKIVAEREKKTSRARKSQ